MASRYLVNISPRQQPCYSTALGEAWIGDSKKLLKYIPDGSVDLIVTSPPYALLKQKEYSNVPDSKYVAWFRPFAKEFHRVLSDEGSLVLNIGGAWNPGSPTRSLYQYKLLLDLCEPSGHRDDPPRFSLAQEFYWFNTAKMPNPAQWVTIERVRVKDAVEHVWWLSKTERPKANNRSVLVPYSKSMERLLKTGRYNAGARPSGWQVSDEWARDNGGAIPPNVLVSNPEDNVYNLLPEANTSSNDVFRKRCRELGLPAHPATFPIAIPDFFIRLLTEENDLVLDPFAGSNTAGYAAETLNRRWLAIDSKAEYVQTSKHRWGNALDNMRENTNGTVDHSASYSTITTDILQ